MAVGFTGHSTTNMWVNDSGERLYLNAARDTVVAEGDPEAAFLLVSAGGMVPAADAAKYGLIDGKTELDFMTPLEREALDDTQAHNDKAAAQKLRTQKHEMGVYMTMDEALAAVQKDRPETTSERVGKPADADTKAVEPASNKAQTSGDKK